MYITTREKHYRDIKPKIICKHYLGVFFERSRDITPELYRVHCFDGRVEFIEVDFTDSSRKEFVNIYTSDGRLLDVTVGYPNLAVELSTGPVLEKIMKLTKILAADFDYCILD
ncbi:hypothetical protein KJJ67_004629 [Salmonella enterica]|nr:hypothetical protein [Salmonella enterica]